MSRTATVIPGGRSCNAKVGGLIYPVLTPLLAERIGWENALHIAGVLGCLAAALWLGIHPAHEGPSSNDVAT